MLTLKVGAFLVSLALLELVAAQDATTTTTAATTTTTAATTKATTPAPAPTPTTPAPPSEAIKQLQKFLKKFMKEMFKRLKSLITSLSDVLTSLVDPDDPALVKHCDKIKRLFDADGKSLAKICVQSAKPASYEDAVAACKKVDLKLLKVTPPMKSPLNKFLQTNSITGEVWVKGADDKKCASVKQGADAIVETSAGLDCTAKQPSFCEIPGKSDKPSD